MLPSIPRKQFRVTVIFYTTIPPACLTKRIPYRTAFLNILFDCPFRPERSFLDYSHFLACRPRTLPWLRRRRSPANIHYSLALFRPFTSSDSEPALYAVLYYPLLFRVLVIDCRFPRFHSKLIALRAPTQPCSNADDNLGFCTTLGTLGHSLIN